MRRTRQWVTIRHYRCHLGARRAAANRRSASRYESRLPDWRLRREPLISTKPAADHQHPPVLWLIVVFCMPRSIGDGASVSENGERKYRSDFKPGRAFFVHDNFCVRPYLSNPRADCADPFFDSYVLAPEESIGGMLRVQFQFLSNE